MENLVKERGAEGQRKCRWFVRSSGPKDSNLSTYLIGLRINVRAFTQVLDAIMTHQKAIFGKEL